MQTSAEWYVLVSSASGKNVFATMGPYLTKAHAVKAADVARVPRYRVAASNPNAMSTALHRSTR
jgi:hypothetical protein